MFYTDDGNYLHFEFQTTDRKEDIKRFLFYDASLFFKEKRKVRTIVIYSSDIENVETYVDAGSIKYNIEAFYMKNLNGDQKLRILEDKILNNETLTGEDIMALTLVPIMSGCSSRMERTIKSIELASKIKNEEEKVHCVSMLYALLEKFGDSYSKKRFKEVFELTEIGKMLIEEGENRGKAELLIKQLMKKFKKVPDNYKEKIRKLPAETLELIAIDIFDMKSIDELEQYF